MKACGLGNPCLPTNWGGMDVGGDPLNDAMKTVFIAGHEKHGNDLLDHNAARALVEGPNLVSGMWNGLETPKDKERYAKDLKIFDRRTLAGITLKWRDPKKKLNRTAIQFFKDTTDQTEPKEVNTSCGPCPGVPLFPREGSHRSF
jgi:hypothetical protein